MYKVIKAFADLEDGRHKYSVGDVYPRTGIYPSEDRISFLSSDRNLLHKPVIAYIPDPKKEAVEKEPVADKESDSTGKKTTRRTRKKAV